MYLKNPRMTDHLESHSNNVLHSISCTDPWGLQEPRCQSPCYAKVQPWIQMMAQFFKSIDSNHMVRARCVVLLPLGSPVSSTTSFRPQPETSHARLPSLTAILQPRHRTERCRRAAASSNGEECVPNQLSKV